MRYVCYSISTGCKISRWVMHSVAHLLCGIWEFNISTYEQSDQTWSTDTRQVKLTDDDVCGSRRQRVWWERAVWQHLSDHPPSLPDCHDVCHHLMLTSPCHMSRYHDICQSHVTSCVITSHQTEHLSARPPDSDYQIAMTQMANQESCCHDVDHSRPWHISHLIPPSHS